MLCIWVELSTEQVCGLFDQFDHFKEIIYCIIQIEFNKYLQNVNIFLLPGVNFSLNQSSLFCNILTKHGEQFSENASGPSLNYVSKGTGWVGSENW